MKIFDEGKNNTNKQIPKWRSIFRHKGLPPYLGLKHNVVTKNKTRDNVPKLRNHMASTKGLGVRCRDSGFII